MAAQAEIINTRNQSKRYERFFYIGMTLAFVITVFAGFARTFFLSPSFDARPLIPLLIRQWIVFSSWLVLFLTQTTLVAANRTRIHRRLGVAGAVIATLMVVIGTITAIIRAKGPSPVPGVNPLSFLTIPLGDIFMFALIVGAGFYFRRRSDVHKRLMLLATIAILPAAVARLPVAFIQQGGTLVFFGLTDLFIVPLLLYDFATRGRPHRATVLGGSLIVLSHPLRLIIGSTHAWLVFATWLTHWS